MKKRKAKKDCKEKAQQKPDVPDAVEPSVTVGKHYTPKQLSNLLGVTIQLLTFLRRTGRGPKYVKFGFRNIIYEAAEVEKFLKERERLSTSDTGNRNPAAQNDDRQL